MTGYPVAGWDVPRDYYAPDEPSANEDSFNEMVEERIAMQDDMVPANEGEAQCDHIRFDPINWIDRLMDVNEGSQFTPDQRATIAAGMMKIRGRLEGAAETTQPHRWNIEQDGDDLMICEGNHHRAAGCEWVRYRRVAD
jgi:hypothetical protein